jgi:hypothetical protein
MKLKIISEKFAIRNFQSDADKRRKLGRYSRMSGKLHFEEVLQPPLLWQLLKQ